MRTSVNVRLDFDRKGGQEACCPIDESCLEQGLGRSNGGLELSYLGKGSGDMGRTLTILWKRYVASLYSVRIQSELSARLSTHSNIDLRLG